MAATATVVAQLNSTSAGSQTGATASFTPAANSKLVVLAIALNNNHTTAKAWTISGGSLSWQDGALSGSMESLVGADFDAEIDVEWADVGASPSSMTVTVDAYSDTSTGWYGVTVFEVVGAEPGAFGAIQAVDFHNPGAATPTLALGVAKSPGSVLLATIFGISDGAAPAWAGDPAGWTVATKPTGTDGVNVAALTSTTDADAALSGYGTTSNTSEMFGVLLEMGAAPTLAYGAAGSVALTTSGGTTLAVGFPTGIDSALSELVLIVGQKPATANGGTITDPSGWTQRVASLAQGGYGATLGDQTGNTNLWFYTQDAPNSSDSGGTLNVTLGDTDVAWGLIVRLDKVNPGGIAWVGRATGETSSGSVSHSFSATDLAFGDVVLHAMDVATSISTPAAFSSWSMTQTGSTIVGNEIAEADNASGNDLGGVASEWVVTNGTGAGTVAVTAAYSGLSTNAMGACGLLRARYVPTCDQEGFRFGLDDGSESAHTWAAAQDTDLSAALGAKLLRILLNAAGDLPSSAPTLRAQKNGTGGYKVVPVGATTTPTLTLGAVGTWSYSTGNPTPAYPAGATALSQYVLVTYNKPSTANGATAPTITGWTLVGSITGANDGDTGGYGATLAADTGNMNLWVFTKDSVDGTESGTVTVTHSASNHAGAAIIRYERNTTDAISVAMATGKDTTAGNVSIVTGSIDLAPSDLILGGMVIPTDVSTPTQFSSHALSATSITFGTVTEEVEMDTTSGNDSGGYLITSSVSSGTATGAVTMTATAGGTTTNVRGPGFILRLRAAAAYSNELYVSTSTNIAAGGEATTPRLTAPSGKTTADHDGGRRWDDENGTDAWDPAANKYGEFEWSLTTQAPATTGDYWDFRAYLGSTALDTYGLTPRWTIGSSAVQMAAALTAPLTASAVSTRTAEFAAALTAPLTASAVATRTAELASALTGPLTATAVATRTAELSAALVGPLTASAVSTRSAGLAAALVAPLTTTAVSTRTAEFAVSLTAGLTAAGVSTRTARFVATLTGPLATSGAATKTVEFQASLTGPLTTAAVGANSLAATLTGPLTVTGAATRTARFAASLLAPLTVTGSGSVSSTSMAAALVAPLTAAAVSTWRAEFAATLTVPLAVTGAASTTVRFQASLLAPLSTSAAGGAGAQMAAALLAPLTVAGVSTRTRELVASLVAPLTVTGAATRTVEFQASLAPALATSGAGTPVVRFAASLIGALLVLGFGTNESEVRGLTPPQGGRFRFMSQAGGFQVKGQGFDTVSGANGRRW